MKTLHTLLVVALLLACGTLRADLAWLADLEAAKARAAKENKDVLVFLTGPNNLADLDEKLLQTEAFKKQTEAQFIAVAVKVPISPMRPSEDLLKLKQQLPLAHFPAALVALDAQGRPYGQAVISLKAEELPTTLTALANQKSKRDALLSAVEKAQGAEKTAALGTALEGLIALKLTNQYPEILKQVSELDDASAALKKTMMNATDRDLWFLGFKGHVLENYYKSMIDAELWLLNFEEAKARAAKENKDLLINFTGSDWCGWCVMLKQEVFSEDAFKNDAGKNFVFVELDYPQGKPQDPAIKEQNAALQKQYPVQGYPTILLTDASGKPYARAGYQAGGPAPYLTLLSTLRENRAKRDALLAEAAKAQGAAKAVALDKVVELMFDAGFEANYSDLLPQIIALDADNAAGVKIKALTRSKIAESRKLSETGDVAGALKLITDCIAAEKLQGSALALANAQRTELTLLSADLLARKSDFDGAMKIIDEHLATDKPAGKVLIRANFMRARLFSVKKDLPNAVKAMETAIAAAEPNSEDALQLGKILERMKADMAKQAAAPAAPAEKATPAAPAEKAGEKTPAK